MADKSFGIRQLNLIGESGTANITSPNNLNLNASNVAISTDVTVGRHLDVDGHAEFDAVNVAGVSTFSDTVNVGAGKSIRLYGASSGYSEIVAAAGSASTTFTLPANGGSNGQYLQTNGSGALSWAGAGKILQVVQGTPKTDTFSTTSTTPVDITGLSVTITPSSTNSKILVYAGVNCGSSANFVGLYLVRGSTYIFQGDTSGSKDRVSINFMTDNNRPSAQTLMFLDEPATTSATTYKMQITTNSTTSWVNRASNESDSNAYMRGASNMIAIEVAG